MSAAVALLAALLPPLALALALLIAERVRRARAEVIARQIALTDAIHRELGAVVAPTVTRTVLGGWRVRVGVPFERPGIAGRVLEIARRAVAAASAPGGRAWEIVLVPQPRRGRPRSAQLNTTTPRAT